ncbi:MAG: hypothetical protein WCJ18_11740, partial [Planctomycetota bacterium]
WPAPNPSIRRPCGAGSWRRVAARQWAFSCGRKRPLANSPLANGPLVSSQRGPKRGLPCRRCRVIALPCVGCGSRWWGGRGLAINAWKIVPWRSESIWRGGAKPRRIDRARAFASPPGMKQLGCGSFDSKT